MGWFYFLNFQRILKQILHMENLGFMGDFVLLIFSFFQCHSPDFLCNYCDNWYVCNAVLNKSWLIAVSSTLLVSMEDQEFSFFKISLIHESSREFYDLEALGIFPLNSIDSAYALCPFESIGLLKRCLFWKDLHTLCCFLLYLSLLSKMWTSEYIRCSKGWILV